MLSDPRHPARNAYALYSSSTSLPTANCSQIPPKGLSEELPGSQPGAWDPNGAVVTPLPHEQPMPMPRKAPPGKLAADGSSINRTADHSNLHQAHDRPAQRISTGAVQLHHDVPAQQNLEQPAQLGPDVSAQLDPEARDRSVLPTLELTAQLHCQMPAQPSLENVHAAQSQPVQTQQQGMICHSSSPCDTQPQCSRHATSANLADQDSGKGCDPAVLEHPEIAGSLHIRPREMSGPARECQQATSLAGAFGAAAGAEALSAFDSANGNHSSVPSRDESQSCSGLPAAILDDEDASKALQSTNQNVGASPCGFALGSLQNAARSKPASTADAKQEGLQVIQLRAVSEGLRKDSDAPPATAYSVPRQTAFAGPDAAHFEDAFSHRDCGNDVPVLHQRANAASPGAKSGNGKTANKPCTWGWDAEILPVLQDHAAAIAELNSRARPSSGVQSAQRKRGACAVM